MTIREIAIFGAGGFGLEVAMLIEQINAESRKWTLIGFFDDGKIASESVKGYPVLGGKRALDNWRTSLDIVFAIGNPLVKKSIIEGFSNDRLRYPSLIHPSVITGSDRFVSIGEGCIICAGTIITTNIKIGRHVILNLACTVGHEASIGDYSEFMPSCNISGKVSIGECSFWGTGAKIINQVSVGDNTVIGAGAVVTRDLPDGVTAVGVPAKIIKTEKKITYYAIL